MPIAVDTNFLIALAEDDGDALDALHTLRDKLPGHRRLVSPTVILETGFLSEQNQDRQLRWMAGIAIRKFARDWQFEYGYLTPAQLGFAEQVAREIRWRGLLPEEEKHDSCIVAEAALLGAVLLVTDDSLIRGIERLPLEILLSDFHLHAPLIITPKEIVRQFYR